MREKKCGTKWKYRERPTATNQEGGKGLSAISPASYILTALKLNILT